MGEIRPKKCEPRELTKDQLAAAGGWAAAASALHHRPLGPARSGKKIWTKILETLAKLRCILTECLTDSFGVFGSPQTSACARASRSPRWRSPSRHKWTSSSRSEFSNEFSDSFDFIRFNSSDLWPDLSRAAAQTNAPQACAVPCVRCAGGGSRPGRGSSPLVCFFRKIQ